MQQSVTVSVEDHGDGIDSRTREMIFDEFFTTRSRGTGIGLAVVKKIADDHGFSVRVESALGEGAEFVIDLGAPLQEAPNAAS